MKNQYRIYIQVPRENESIGNDYSIKSQYYINMFKSVGITNIKLIGCNYVGTDSLNIIISMFVTCTDKQLTTIILKTNAHFEIDNEFQIL